MIGKGGNATVVLAEDATGAQFALKISMAWADRATKREVRAVRVNGRVEPTPHVQCRAVGVCSATSLDTLVPPCSSRGVRPLCNVSAHVLVLFVGVGSADWRKGTAIQRTNTVSASRIFSVLGIFHR